MNEEEMPTEGNFELFMPFVTVQSNGGPHEDGSYVAGWECGALDERLSAAKLVRALELEATVHTDNLPQMDLLAMKHGYRMAKTDPTLDVVEGWTFVTFIALEPNA